MISDIHNILKKCVTQEALGYRIVDFDHLRSIAINDLFKLGRKLGSKPGDSSNASEQTGAHECAITARSLAASLLIMPAKAPDSCPVLNVETISTEDAVLYFKKGLDEKLGPPTLFSENYPAWELAICCYSLAIIAEYRGPLYLGTLRETNETDMALGIWNFSIKGIQAMKSWNEYLNYCQNNSWDRSKALGRTSPGMPIYSSQHQRC